MVSILLCYDASASAKRALAVAHATLGGGRLTLLHVFNPPDAVLADAFSVPSGATPTARLEELAVQRAETIAREGEELARELGFEVQTRVERNGSAVWRVILDVAEEIEAELIVVGTHGTTAVAPALLGSVSGAVVHHSTCPILVVPAATGAAVGDAASAEHAATRGSPVVDPG